MRLFWAEGLFDGVGSTCKAVPPVLASLIRTSSHAFVLDSSLLDVSCAGTLIPGH